MDGDTSGVQFEYSWEKKGSCEAEVIKDFSNSSYVLWTPPAIGDYVVSVAAKDIDGNIKTANKEVAVLHGGGREL